MPPRKAAEITTLLIDINATANKISSTNQEETDFDISVAIADAIICRKIFQQVPDLYSVIFFGFGQGLQGFYVASDFEEPSFDVVEKLDEVKPGTTSTVTVKDALERAIDGIKQYKDENPKSNINSTIFMMSNLDCTPAALLSEHSAEQLGKKLHKSGTELFVASPDDVVNDESKGAKMRFMTGLQKHAGAIWLSFGDCQKRFGSFGPKPKAPRGMPFDLKLDNNIDIKLQMFIKNSSEKILPSFKLCTPDGKEVKKSFQHTARPDMVVEMEDLDVIKDEEFSSGKFSSLEDQKRVLEKSDLVNAYYYGKTVVPVDNELIKEDFAVDKSGKELNLIQFTSKDNILPQYIISAARYLLPVQNTEGSQRVLMSLVKELRDKNLVAIVRYAYNVNSYSRIACLIPKITKSGMPMFIHYILPHGDDMRNYEFKNLDVSENEITDFQEDAIKDFIDNLMLPDEDFRPKYVPDPRMNHECLQLRNKALNPTDTIPNALDTTRVIKNLSMPETKETLDAVANLGKAFDLVVNEHNRQSHFGNRPLGMDPIEFNQQARRVEEEVSDLKKEEK